MKQNDVRIEKNLKLIGQALKELRIRKGWKSYETFAIENDLDRKQYWRIESGTNITLKSLIRILNIHRISLHQFFMEIKL
ncbi:MAG TPA: helix-turn-helix transcriptional regulator [Bacteroidia bacterium]|nr:MAG: helix-turn-helix domain-containing protein [Bacteroidetes bacterium OLB10]MBV6454930.1 hypothetical protein [Bacteroidia bacterium]MBX3106764.1 helix-turn-helix transcriptional regulator [Bacteroidota bacterium]OQB61726.1 MAG: Helix-turn-helix domain protein [Bacteroidetes bacterium ADurb.Bin141]MCW5932320.1 helix-turn-helix transcriptional regulator [Bacteroidota bacterium]